jgi:hypothetical protein
MANKPVTTVYSKKTSHISAAPFFSLSGVGVIGYSAWYSANIPTATKANFPNTANNSLVASVIWVTISQFRLRQMPAEI